MINLLKININNITSSDQAYIRTFMHFLPPPMNGKWKITEKNAHIYFTNTDDYKNINSIIVKISAEKEIINSENFNIKKPLQLDDFIDLLSNIQKNLINNNLNQTTSEISNKEYKLTRWPPAILLKKDPNFSRLSSTLINRYLSLQEIQSLTNLTEDFCFNFIKELDENNCLSMKNKESNLTNNPEKNIFSFITKLRNKFGI